MTKFTPGPWEAVSDAVPPSFVQITVYAESSGDRVATVFSEADAQAIKALPDLLEACRMLERRGREQLDTTATQNGLCNCDLLATARAAITKATGEDQ